MHTATTSGTHKTRKGDTAASPLSPSQATTPQSPILLGADVVESKRGSVVLQRASSSGHDLQALMDSPRATRSATGSLPPANERRKFDDLLGSPVRSPSTPTHSHGGSSGGAQHKKGTWPALGSLMTPSTGTPSSVNPWTLAKKRTKSGDEVVSPSSISATSSRHSGAHTQVSSQEKEPVTPGGFVLLMPVAPPEDMEKIDWEDSLLLEEGVLENRKNHLCQHGLFRGSIPQPAREPPVRTNHWDYLLQEMEIRANTLIDNFWARMRAVSAINSQIRRIGSMRESEEERQEKAVEKYLRQVSLHLMCMVKWFWGNMDGLARFKIEEQIKQRELSLAAKKQELLVRRTEKFSSLIAKDIAVASPPPSRPSLGSPFSPMQPPSPRSEAATASSGRFSAPQEDVDFQLADADDEKDDEETLEEEERLGGVDYQMELEELDRESKLPLEELKRKYFMTDESEEDIASMSSMSVDEEESQQEEEEEEGDSSDAEFLEEEEDDGDSQISDSETRFLLEMEEDDGPLPGSGGVERDDIQDMSAWALEAQPTGNTYETTTVNTSIPTLLAKEFVLRQYQHVGLDWLVAMHDKGLNGILADEMGLGKTIQTISLLAWLAEEKHTWGQHLIVVPTSVMINWEIEFKRWCPSLKILVYHGTLKERKAKRQGWSDPNSFDVCITSYQLAVLDAPIFKRREWYYLILDEAHNIKNFRSQRWETLVRFNTRRRLLLTGTPLQNSVMELWSLMHFLMPDLFSSHQEFKDWFSSPLTNMVEGGTSVNNDLVERLHSVLRPFILRRLKSEVEKQMPEKYEHIVPCPLSKRQRFLYEEFMNRFETRKTLSGGSFFGIIGILSQLRKVCNHPDLFEERPIISPFDSDRLEYSVPSPVLLEPSIQEQTGITLQGLGFLLGELLDAGTTSLVSERIADLLPAAMDEPWDVISRKKENAASRLRRLEKRAFRGAQTTPAPSSVLEPLQTLQKLAKRRSKLHALNARCNRLRVMSETNRLHGREPLSRRHCLGFDVRAAVHISEADPRCRVSAWVESCENLREDPPQAQSRTVSWKSLLLYSSPQDVANHLREIVHQFSCSILPARALPMRIKSPHTDPAWLIREQNTRDSLHGALHQAFNPFHDAWIRKQLFFPDRMLVQFDCGKLQVLATLLRDLKTAGHRVLIFTQMSRMLNVLETFLCLHGHTYLRLDGATKIEQRQQYVERFNTDDRIFCFILSTRSGGFGINLTGADTVIFYDSDWNPAMDAQAQDRCHRIGQTRDVHIYRLVSLHTIEENILLKAKQKRDLDHLVIQSGGFTTDFFRELDLRQILVTEEEDTGAVEKAPVEVDAATSDFVAPRSQQEIDQALAAAEDVEDRNAALTAVSEEALEMADFTDNVEGSADSEAQKAVTGVGSGGGGSSDPPVAPLPSPRPVVMVNTLDDLERTLKALSPVQRMAFYHLEKQIIEEVYAEKLIKLQHEEELMAKEEEETGQHKHRHSVTNTTRTTNSKR